MARLRKELDGEIVVYGSRRLSLAMIGMGLVDELRLLVYLVVLGAGDRLFGEAPDRWRRAWSNQVRPGDAA